MAEDDEVLNGTSNQLALLFGQLVQPLCDSQVDIGHGLPAGDGPFVVLLERTPRGCANLAKWLTVELAVVHLDKGVIKFRLEMGNCQGRGIPSASQWGADNAPRATQRTLQSFGLSLAFVGKCHVHVAN
jgi:hypothetical protein